MQFELTKHQTMIANVNSRKEKHGEENKLACDVKFRANANNNILDAFGKDFRTFLFRKPAVGEQQTLEGIADNLIGIKHPELAPQKLELELPGYELKIAAGMGLAEPIHIPAIDLKRFEIEPVEGGNVVLTFTGSFPATGELIGQLAELQQEQVEVTLEAPKAEKLKKVA